MADCDTDRYADRERGGGERVTHPHPRRDTDIHSHTHTHTHTNKQHDRDTVARGVNIGLGPSQIPDTLSAINMTKEHFLEKRARVKENGGVDPDAPEEPEPVATGAKANGAVKVAAFELANADFPGTQSTVTLSLSDQP